MEAELGVEVDRNSYRADTRSAIGFSEFPLLFNTAAVYADPLEASSMGRRSCTGRRVGADEVLSAQVVCGGAADLLPASSLTVSRRSPDVTAAPSSTSLRWSAN
jgi:hypothetical protein